MRPQLSLRELFLVVLVVALTCGWWTEHRRTAASQERAAFWQAQAEQGQGHARLYRGLYAAVERSGFHVVWSLHGVPQRLIPASPVATRPANIVTSAAGRP